MSEFEIVIESNRFETQAICEHAQLLQCKMVVLHKLNQYRYVRESTIRGSKVQSR